MEVKNEPVDIEYNEKGHPPDDAWSDLLTVKPEAPEIFEDACLIQSEFKTDIKQPISKKDVALGVCGVKCKKSENGENLSYSESELNNQISTVHNPATSLRPLYEYLTKTAQESLHDIDIDEIDVKKEVLGHRPIVVVVNLEKKVFHERNFICCICMQLFSSCNSLSLHRNVHHTSLHAKRSRDSTFQFDTCENDLISNQHFNINPSLISHKLSHTVERSFKCDQLHEDHNDKPLKTESLELDDCLEAQLTLTQNPGAQKSSYSLRPSSPISFDDIEIEENNVKKEILGHTPIVVIINLQKEVFHDRNFVCSICMKLFSSLDSLSLHRTIFHKSILSIENTRGASPLLQLDVPKKGSTPSECDDGGFESAYRIFLQGHKLNYSHEQLFDKEKFDSENNCNRKKTWRNTLKTHHLSHNSEKPFECDQCEYKSALKSLLKTHKLAHTGVKTFKCDQCNYKSAQKSNLKTHKLCHTSGKSFKCNQCNYKSAQKSHLNSHKLSHTGEEQFVCEICDFKTAYKKNLKTHKLMHTGLKPFECDQCGYKAAHKRYLKNHKMSHTGEKPFSCDICDYKAAKRSSLKTHTLSHIGENTFDCNHCDYKSTRKTNLNQHKLLHSVEKPFGMHGSRP